MSIVSWPAVKNASFEHWARLLALLIVAWSPFPGGPRMPSLLLAAMGAWLLWRRRAALWESLAVRRFALIFALLWVPVLWSVPFSVDIRKSAQIAAALPLFGLAGLALLHALRDAGHRQWLVKWLGVVLLLWAFDGLVQYLFGRDLLGIPLTADGRVQGMFEGNLHLALLLSVLAPLALALLLPLGPSWALAAFAVVAVVVALSGVRMSYVMLAIAAVGLFLRLPRGYRWPAVALAALLPVVLWSASPLLQERVTWILSARSLDFQGIDTMLSGRLTIWESAARMLADRPLTGVGAGAFAAAYDSYSTRPDDMFRTGGAYAGGVYHAHQLYVSVGAESGVAGLAAVLLAWFLGLRWYLGADAARRAAAWPFAFSLFIATFPVNSQPVMYTLWWFPVLLLLLSATLAALGAGRPGGQTNGVAAARAARSKEQ